MFIKCKKCGAEFNTRFMDKCLCETQEDMPEDFKEVVNKNFWDLI